MSVHLYSSGLERGVHGDLVWQVLKYLEDFDQGLVPHRNFVVAFLCLTYTLGDREKVEKGKELTHGLLGGVPP